MTDPPRSGRRDVLRLGLGAMAALLAPSRRATAATRMASMAPPAAAAPLRRLAFRNLHTDESVDVVYCAAGRFVPEALREIDWVLRDHRTGEAHRMDVRLLDMLHRLRMLLDTGEPYEVISGYRSPETNAMLVRTTSGVARGSLHTRAMAIDVRVPRLELETLRDTALGLRAGGVGYYPRSRFVHVDVGRFRTW